MIRMKSLAFIVLAAFGASNASAVELLLSSNVSEISQDMLKETITSALPAEVVRLNGGYKLYAVVETADYKPGERLFSYSVQLHKRVIEAETGKVYWVNTGGIRGHGVAVSSDTILGNLKSDIVAGSGSFKLDQI